MESLDVKELKSALRDIAYALQELNNSIIPHGGSYEVNRLLKCAHDAIDKLETEGA